jgi:threonine dehydrogenase-like Zn-dependent dehydrogenase
LLITV